ncbi:MAG: D-alanine--D-alanine ligase, partial [Actinobacteria bacterium]|nr:D-alanine--D-alanine ligase [Actinomycetota bacterium]NIS37394.1 D-alanine--D-alanine ligase [Actinomycetota bacterium]NIT99258.1 D-alanine--D-alanine ligase [Actinomycetota bacterium]NIU71824.1 D-alanine--D-alanine ligase [Actinomycetota bacterium]NIV91089.1 D-alanine--D-alanine ligase [Actinomycetota bacterium]
DWPCDPRPFLPDADWTLLTLEKDSCVADIMRAANGGYDLFFNLCDGAWDEGRVGVEVVQTLETLGLPFTGADSAFFEPSREAMKRVCRAWGIDTPAYRFASDDDGIARAAAELSFPLFVKHPSSYASHSLTRESRVATEKELIEQARRMIDKFGSTLVEEYVEGLECTSLVVENADDPADPIVYTPLQYRFPDGEAFKHYDLKWVDYDGLSSSPVEDDEVAGRIRRASADFFRGMRGA